MTSAPQTTDSPPLRHPDRRTRPGDPAAGRPVPARQRQVDRAHRDPVATRRGRARSTSSPRRPRRPCARSSRRRSTAEPGTEERKFGDVYSRASWTRTASSSSGCRAPPSRSRRRADVDLDRRRSSRDRRAASSVAARADSSSSSSTTTRATRSATWCSSSRAASACPTSRTSARRSSPRSARGYVELSSSGCSSLAGLSMPAERAERVFALETEIAAQHWDNVRIARQRGDLQPPTWNDVATAGGARRGARPEPWLDGIDAPTASFDEVVVRQPSFVEALPALVDGRAPRELEGLAALAGHPLERSAT